MSFDNLDEAYDDFKLDHGPFIYKKMPKKGDIIQPFYGQDWEVVSSYKDTTGPNTLYMIEVKI